MAVLDHTCVRKPGIYAKKKSYIKPFFLPNVISTPSVRAGSSSERDTIYVVADCETEKTKATALKFR